MITHSRMPPSSWHYLSCRQVTHACLSTRYQIGVIHALYDTYLLMFNWWVECWKHQDFMIRIAALANAKATTTE